MTISSATRKAGPFLGNGVTSLFPFTFKCFSTGDIRIIKTSTLGVDSSLVLNSDYSVTLNADQNASPGGSITFPLSGALLQTGEKLTATGVLSALQQTHITNGGNFFANNIEDQMDYLTILIQQLAEQLARVALASSSDVNPVLSIGTAVQRALKYITFDASGNLSLAQSLPSGTLSQASIVAFLGGDPINHQSAAELSANLNPANFSYLLGSVLRYGLIPNSTAAASNNTTILRALWNPLVVGPVGLFQFPNTTGADVYYVNGPILIRDGVHIDLNQCQIATPPGTTAGVNDQNSAIFMAMRDCVIENGSFLINMATGAISSCGAAVQFGTRGVDSLYWSGVGTPFPTGVFDAALASPQGNCRLSHVRITINASGANLASVAAVNLIGGLKNIDVDVIINGSGTLQQGISQEFGWATSDTQPSARQTSYLSDCRINARITNMDNVTAISSGIVLAGAYDVTVERYFFSGVSRGATVSSAEAMFFRPWVGVDDAGAKRNIVFKSVTGENFSNSGLSLSGTQARAAGSGFMQRAWVALTAYGVRETVINGGNMYVCTIGGAAAGAGGPTGTGTGIVDGTVTWNYVPLTANTDLLDCEVDAFALSPNSGADGIDGSCGYLSLRNGTINGGNNPLFLFAECTRIDMEGVRLTGGQQAGAEMATAAGQIWPVLRLKKISVRNCYVAKNSASSAGVFAGLNINNCQGALIENSRINDDVNYNGVAETTQGTAINVGANAFGVVARLNHIGNIVGGGNFAYASGAAGGSLNGNDIVNPLGVFTIAGPWNVDGTGSATTAQLTDKTSNANMFGKYERRRMFNSSNSRALLSTGPNNTSNWAYCDGNAPGTITPV